MKSLGTKRSCPECQSKFYDLGKTEGIECPRCKRLFTLEEILGQSQKGYSKPDLSSKDELIDTDDLSMSLSDDEDEDDDDFDLSIEDDEDEDDEEEEDDEEDEDDEDEGIRELDPLSDFEEEGFGTDDDEDDDDFDADDADDDDPRHLN